MLIRLVFSNTRVSTTDKQIRSITTPRDFVVNLKGNTLKTPARVYNLFFRPIRVYTPTRIAKRYAPFFSLLLAVSLCSVLVDVQGKRPLTQPRVGRGWKKKFNFPRRKVHPSPPVDTKVYESFTYISTAATFLLLPYTPGNHHPISRRFS